MSKKALDGTSNNAGISGRRMILLLCDVFIIVSAYICAMFICAFAFKQQNQFTSYAISLVFASSLYTLALIISGVYGNIWRYARDLDFFKLMLVSAASGLVYFAVERYVIGTNYPFCFYVVHGALTALGLIAERYLYKIHLYYSRSPRIEDDRQRTLVVGAGRAARTFIEETNSYVAGSYKPVAILDDDKQKIGRYICGVKVMGMIASVAEVSKKVGAQIIVIAIPSANNQLRAQIIEQCREATLPIKIMPHIGELDVNRPLSDRMRDVTPDELLGRDPISLPTDEIVEFIDGHTVAITGGGGSIGSELCRQIARCSPKRLIIIDIYENNAYDIQQELKSDYGSKLDLRVYIASVRDAERIKAIFAHEKPDLVFHAAAHKHVPLMEYSPTEAVKNNVFGTLNTARAAAEAGVKKFILISTDKAVNPTNIMGASKRVCEMIVQSMNGKSSTVFAAVRFGNVLGSNGSVIPLFKRQIGRGGPVEVTSREVNRFFMTIPEAAQLVLTAGAKADGGEIFILNMAKSVKISELAVNLIKCAGYYPYESGETNIHGDRGIMIKYIGLRPGEKEFEELSIGSEDKRLTDDGKIYIAHSTPFDVDMLNRKLDELYKSAQLDEKGANTRIGGILGDIIGTYHVPNNRPNEDEVI